MKLPFIFSVSGGHEPTFDQDDFDTENQDDISSDNAESFEEYLWMENEEEFDKSELQRLEEEALMKECMENMQEDGYDSDELIDTDNGYWPPQIETMNIQYNSNELSKIEVTPRDIEKSTLNPLAQEFFPSSVRLK